MDVTFLNKKVFLCTEVEVGYKSLFQFNIAHFLTSIYVFELGVHRVVPTVKTGEQIVEQFQFIETLLLYEIAERKSGSEGCRDKAAAIGWTVPH